MKYSVDFTNISDVRMGSPFNIATVVLHGSYLPSLEPKAYQDIFLLTENSEAVILIKWAFDKNNVPGFVAERLSSRKQTVERSHRIPGCCRRLYLDGGKIMAEIFDHPADKTVEIKF